ncbi:MAG: N-formylglutamate deformylase, partial [Proteobacteria bacterium]|nr:N-formylglutamate deformylase [Pseudomonadota bacterium]
MKIHVESGDSPLVLAQPHGGIEIPPDILQRLNDTGQALEDTDWHIQRLHHGLIDKVTVVSTPIHRYVIDANRDPSDQSLYPGQNTTSLCPTTTFDGDPIYRDGEEPGEEEIRERRQRYHQPYHDALAEQLERVHQRHGYVVLYDCHSIRSQIPYLFDGRLADFNIGTNSGASCNPGIESCVLEACAKATQYTHVTNGRFKGGWTTRHYGDPARGYHAIQMELSQCNYMTEKAPWAYDIDKA